MSTADGKLTDEDKSRIVKWLQTKTTIHSCPSCGSNNWTVGDDLINLMPFTGGNLIIGGPTYPAAFVVCNSCAFIKHFMAVPIGVVNAAPKEGGGNG